MSPSVGNDAGERYSGVTTRRKKPIIDSHARGSHYVFTHSPKDPNCEACKKDKSPPERGERPNQRRAQMVLRNPRNLEDIIAADHTILNVEDGSRCGH